MFEILNDKVIYKINNEEVGYVLFSKKDNNMISIDKVYVKENHRGKGIAREMLEYTYDYFTKRKIKILYECSYSKGWNKKIRLSNKNSN